MSGLEEQSYYPPMCSCGRTHEYLLSTNCWILPKSSMIARDLDYPVICLDRNGAQKDLLVLVIRCLGCGRAYYRETKIFNEIMDAYNTWIGRPYHTTICIGTDRSISDKWISRNG